MAVDTLSGVLSVAGGPGSRGTFLISTVVSYDSGADWPSAALNNRGADGRGSGASSGDCCTVCTMLLHAGENKEPEW